MRNCKLHLLEKPKLEIPDLKSPVVVTEPSPATFVSVQRSKRTGRNIKVAYNDADLRLSFLGRSQVFNLYSYLPKKTFKSPFFNVWSDQYGETYLMLDQANQWHIGPFFSPEQKLLVTLYGLNPPGRQFSTLAYPDLINFIIGHYFDPNGEWLERHFERAFGASEIL
ncbi:MAG: hypothetical protein NVSMB39_0120 [Candidatus Saccharimonadales bacterium]